MRGWYEAGMLPPDLTPDSKSEIGWAKLSAKSLLLFKKIQKR